MSSHFLFHYTPPRDLGPEPLLLLLSEDGEITTSSLPQLSKLPGAIITYRFSPLVEWFRQKQLPLPRTVIDVVIAKKLIVGLPKSAFSDTFPWDPWQLVESYLDKRDRSVKGQASLRTQLVSPKRGNLGNIRWGIAILHGLRILWSDLRGELSRLGEEKRFFDVEVPVYNFLLEIQYKGIEVKNDAISAFVTELEDNYINAHHALTITHGLDVRRAFSDGEYLRRIIALPDAEWVTSQTPEQIIRLFKNTHEVCNRLYSVWQSRRNKGILLRTFSRNSATSYVEFDSMGTVTGRILAIDPQLQHLKKKYRSVIAARPGRRLLYVDYSQFEPNIMASLSRDSTLMSICRDGDLYTHVAQLVFGSKEHRDSAKQLVMAYSYGMELSGLVRMVSEIVGDTTVAEKRISQEFLSMLAGIEVWKETIFDELARTGRVATVEGNYRYRTSQGPLSSKERRWVLSQLVQGTGALILKRLLLTVGSLVPEAGVLLPVYDAVLFELPIADWDSMVSRIVSCFESAFGNVCPGIHPRVKCDAFG